MPKRTCTYFDFKLVKILHCTSVQARLKFAVAAWCPSQKSDIAKLEKV
jgi:hypothetical protein